MFHFSLPFCCVDQRLLDVEEDRAFDDERDHRNKHSDIWCGLWSNGLFYVLAADHLHGPDILQFIGRLRDRPKDRISSLKFTSQLLEGRRQRFRQRPCLSDARHEVGVTDPAGKHVHMIMPCNPRTGRLAEVHPEINAVWVIDRPDRLNGTIDKIHHLIG